MNLFPYLLIVIFFVGCTTLDLLEINQLDKASFEPLRLKPAYEPNDLRIDLFRQTETVSTSDSTSETRNVPYHPLGFNLGNGLFYDLNQNLSFRIDSLLMVPEGNFEIKKLLRPGKNPKTVNYCFHNDTLSIKHDSGKKARYIYHKAGSQNEMSFFNHRHTKYSISTSDNSVIYSRKKRIMDGIYFKDWNNYTVGKNRHKRSFHLGENAVYLEKTLILAQPEPNTILVKYSRRKKGQLVYTIIRNPDKIIAYHPDHRGIKLVFENNHTISVYSNKTLITKYSIEK